MLPPSCCRFIYRKAKISTKNVSKLKLDLAVAAVNKLPSSRDIPALYPVFSWCFVCIKGSSFSVHPVEARRREHHKDVTQPLQLTTHARMTCVSVSVVRSLTSYIRIGNRLCMDCICWPVLWIRHNQTQRHLLLHSNLKPKTKSSTTWNYNFHTIEITCWLLRLNILCCLYHSSYDRTWII